MADAWNHKTKLPFSEPIEVPGKVLPAGEYTFKLMDSQSDRHIVEIYNASKYFSDRITRVEVHLTYVDAEKFGQGDKHCLIEARPAGHEPVVATGKAPNLKEAIQEAADKMQRLLSHLFGRLDGRY